GHGEARVHRLALLRFELVVEALEQRLLHARRSRWQLLRRRARRERGHHRHQLLEVAALAEEDTERLVKQDRVLVALHEHRMQCPVEVVARADAGRLESLERVEHGARSDRDAGGAQRAREVDDVLGEAPLRIDHCDYSAARISARTWSISSFAFEPSMRAMSSWDVSSTASGSDTVCGSSAIASSSVSAVAQSSVSATPGDLNRSSLRSAWTKCTISWDRRAPMPGTLVRTIDNSRSAVG